MTRALQINVLPGQPTDGKGKVAIHLFVRDDQGLFVEGHVLDVVDGVLVQHPRRGRLACDPKRRVTPTTRNGVTVVTPRTDDPRAATCLKCRASADYAEMISRLEPQPVQP